MPTKPFSQGTRVIGINLVFPGSKVTNPADQQVMADTGALDAGSYFVSVQGSGSVAFVYDLERRNAANSAVVTTNGQAESHRRRCAAGNEEFFLGVSMAVLIGERIRVLMQGAVTGQVQLSLLIEPTEA